jgi:fucose 4-O-acetylase-like acetyltransferase
MMLIHKITDTHIIKTGGTIRGLFSAINIDKILTEINWQHQWSFVFKKTIVFFWIPAHTITFLLPAELQVLFAALLGVILGVLLAFASPVNTQVSRSI